MMAGVVRRDGLREAIDQAAQVLDAHGGNISWTSEELACALADAGLLAVPDVPPTEDDWREANRYYDDDPGLLPDVPPDPPAADRSAIIAVFGNLARELGYANPSWGQLADALLSSGVLVDAADVRARAWRWAASFGTFPGKSWPETLRYHAEHGAAFDRDEPDYFDEQGVSEREGASDG